MDEMTQAKAYWDAKRQVADLERQLFAVDAERKTIGSYLADVTRQMQTDTPYQTVDSELALKQFASGVNALNKSVDIRSVLADRKAALDAYPL